MRDLAGNPVEVDVDWTADPAAVLLELRRRLAHLDNGPPPVLSAEVRDGLRAAAQTDPAVLDDASLLAAAGELERAQRFLDAARVHVAAEIDSRGATVGAAGLKTVGWYGSRHGLSRATASRLVRTGRKLRDQLDVVDDALTAGETTLDHAAHLARQCQPRVGDTVAAAQEALLALADGARFEAWAEEVRDLIRLADEDGAHDPRLEDNNLTMASGLAGELFLKATLVGDGAVSFREGVVSLADELQLQAVRDHERCPELPVPSRSTLLGLALAEMARRSQAARGGRAPGIDATLVIPAGDPTHPDAPPAGTGDAAGTGEGTAPDGRVPHLLGLAWTPLVRDRHGVPLQDGTARVLCCDAAITALVVDSLGTPLDLGFTHRHPTPQQRRALHVRDGGCVWPGCDAPPEWCDAHHVVPWDPDQRAGPTDLANLALTCRHHHRIAHRPGWSLRAGVGATLRDHHPRRAGPAEPAQRPPAARRLSHPSGPGRSRGAPCSRARPPAPRSSQAGSRGQWRARATLGRVPVGACGQTAQVRSHQIRTVRPARSRRAGARPRGCRP